MVVATWDDVAHIARLHSIIAIFIHQVERLLHVTLVVLRRATCLVVHQQLYTLTVGIVVEHLDIEVGIRRHEVEDIALPHVCPVFPTNVPTLDKHLVETVLGSKVDVALHVFVVGLVSAIGLHLRPVNLVELDAGVIVGIVPVATTHNHLPPDTTVLRGMNP